MTHKQPTGYESKFAGFIDLCANTKPKDAVVVATPSALGDTYDELIESLSRLARAQSTLHIAEPQ